MGLKRAVKQVLRRHADAAAAEIEALAQPAPTAPARAPADRRSARAIARVVERAYNTLVSYPGIGVEELAQRMRVKSRVLTLPLSKLRAAKRVTVEGEKRRMRYTAVVS